MEELPLSEYRGVWVFAMFDLPVDTKADRRHYTQFRNMLLKLGFQMLQFSVYAHYFPSEEDSIVHRKKVRAGLPPGGQVRLVTITDKQFGKMEVFLGKKKVSSEDPPQQMLLF
jgi:CRISPR-associated protein Cas2